MKCKTAENCSMINAPDKTTIPTAAARENRLEKLATHAIPNPRNQRNVISKGSTRKHHSKKNSKDPVNVPINQNINDGQTGPLSRERISVPNSGLWVTILCDVRTFSVTCPRLGIMRTLCCQPANPCCTTYTDHRGNNHPDANRSETNSINWSTSVVFTKPPKVSY